MKYKQSSQPSPGLLVLLLVAFLFSTYGIMAREASEMFGPYTQATMRQVFCVIALAAFASFASTPMKVHRSHWKSLIFVAVCGVPIALAFTKAVIELPLAEAIALMYSGQIIVSTIIGKLRHQETVGLTHITALMFAIAGLYIFAGHFDILSRPAIEALLAGVFCAIQNSYIKLVKDLNKTTVMFYQFAGGSVLGLAVAVLSGEEMIVAIDLSGLVANVIYAAIVLGVAWLLLYGFKHADLRTGNIVLSMELPFSTLAGWLVFRETLSNQALFGSGLLLITMTISSWPTRNKSALNPLT